MRFELASNRVGEVSIGGGPMRYQRVLKRAVHGLQCDSGSAAAQTVALSVRFVDPFAAQGERAVALIALEPAR